MEKKLSVALSFLLHPVFLPLLSVAVLLYSPTYLRLVLPEWKQRILIITAVGTIVMPLCLIPIFYFRKFTGQIPVRKNRERFLILFISTICYYFTYNLLQHLSVPGILQVLLLGATITVFILMLITVFYRVSLHTAAWGGITGIFLAMSLRFGMAFIPWLVATIFLAGFAGSSRLVLEAHKPSEIYVGYLTGSILNFVLMYFLQ